MDKEEFLKTLKGNLHFIMGSKYEIKFISMPKNNGVMEDSVSISKVGENVGKILHFEYDAGDGYDEIYNKALYIVDDYENSMDLKQDVASLLKWEKSKDLVIYTLINLEANRERLRNMPHVVLSDLAMVFFISIEEDGSPLMIWIVNEIVKAWGIDVECLPEIARKNTMEQYPAVIGELSDIIGVWFDKEETAHEVESVRGLYVLTNEITTYGAAVVFYNRLLKTLADRVDGDLILIPLSIHEMLAKKKEDTMCQVDYKLMQNNLIQCNSEGLHVKERLSNNLYVYSREKDEITQVTECDLGIEEI